MALAQEEAGEEIPTAGRVAAANATTDDGPRVTIREVDSKSYSSAPGLAQAVGSPVLEPTWWPADTA